jgi:UDP-N-acetylmuramate dehydrogenase
MAEMIVEHNVSLSMLTTFRVGGPAEHFVVVGSVEELHQALGVAKEKTWPIFILAHGSNVIASDDGVKGLVILVDIKSWQIEGDRLTSGAGTPMSQLVDATISAGLKGLEWAGGLPGSFGGAIRGNAGAFGGEIKDTITSVVSIDIHTGKEIIRDRQECQFIYRGSFFKQAREIIISATLQLTSGQKDELRSIANDHIRYRQEHHPMEYPNSGSIFKNTPVEKVPKEIIGQFESVIKTDPFRVVPTAAIIAQAGLAGEKVGQAQLSTKHTNYIVNLGGAKANDIVALIRKIQTTVKDKYGIELETEPEFVGTF